MPFDSNGNFSLVPGTIVSDGMTIQPSQHNPPFQDVANGLSQVVLRDGRAPLTGNLNLNGFKVTGSGAATQPNDLVSYGQVSSAIYQIGDFKDTARTLDSNWLKRDGSTYNINDYPVLAALMPPLPSGVVWTPKLNGISSAAFSIIKTSLGYFVNHISSSDTAINFSTNGASWSSSGTIADMVPTRGKGLAFGNNRVVVIGTGSDGVKTSYSTNGSTWNTPVVIGGSGAPAGSIAYGNGYFIASWRASSNTLFGFYRSPDATSWSAGASYGTGTPINGIEFLNDRFAIFCTNGKILTTSDGVSITEVTTISGASFNCAAYRDGVHLFAGANGVCYITSDYSTFTPIDIGTTDDIYSAVSHPTGFLLIGEAGTAVISNSDLSVWEDASVGAADLNGVVSTTDQSSNFFMVGPPSGNYHYGVISSTQFQVPDDDPEYGWIKAL